MEADKNYMLRQMIHEAATNDALARKFADKLREMAKKNDKDNAEGDD